MKKQLRITGALLLMLCGSLAAQEKDFIEENIAFARKQIGNEIRQTSAAEKIGHPVTLKRDGTTYYCGYSDWRSGFFAGTLWHLYDLTGHSGWRAAATKYTWDIEKAKGLTWHHDVGFIIECSFGNGLRLSGDSTYEAVIVEAARSLSTRFRQAAGVLQSWDVKQGWQSERGWQCPVIVDNLMNLELLFHATRLSGDSTFYNIAVSHADRTLAEQFRPDGSCYHVVDYDPTTGAVRSRQTAQGYADESAWSRGQAWAIYGYTVCFRETGDRKYLDQAIRTFDFMKEHPRLAEDRIPYWDMDAPNIPDEPRDASSAACIASALYELSSFDLPDAASYSHYADQIMASLASPAYRSAEGANGNFLLMHSVGSIPHDSEIDVPLNYADYYFMEALKRKKTMQSW